MKKLIFISFLFIATTIKAATYWVTPRGLDTNTGHDSSSVGAWKTWHYAFNHVTPSDTVYFRGGVYTPYSASIGASINTIVVDGTRNNPTCFFAYPPDYAAGNYPILDCQTMMTDAVNYGIEISRAHNIYFKGLTLRNVRQTNPGVGNARGWMIWSEYGNNLYVPNNLRFENCITHNIGGSGFGVSNADTVYFVNCDAYNCADTLNTSDPGGGSAGFAIGLDKINQITGELAYIYYYGCRAWKCSDQGWSISTSATVVIDHCWSLWNGDNPFSIVYEGDTYTNYTSKGSGWKFWYYADRVKNTTNVVQLTMRNCIAAYNMFKGINWTDRSEPGMPEIRAHIYNNFIYNTVHQVLYKPSCWGYGLEDDVNTDTVGRWDHKYYNNLSYHNNDERDIINGVYHGATNKFDISGTTISDEDFVSLDTTGMIGNRTRQADGSLPATNFGHLASSSECINTGTYVGLDTIGSGADIGWTEYEPQNPPVDPTLATLATYHPYWLTATTASTGGFVSDNGGGTVSARGVCWNTTGNPTTANSKTDDGTGDGAFTSTMTGLTQGTIYYVRAYATNEVGTAYGSQMTFRTQIIKHDGKINKHNGKFIIN